ncbi:Trichome differentiation protein GL1 [Entamoeba marina]
MTKVNKHITNTLDSCSNDSDVSKKKRKKGTPWEIEEDHQLIEAVALFGTKHWVQIAQYIGTRNRKQCRERYINHINPSIDKKPWSEHEDFLVLQQYKLYGNKWGEINKSLKGRTARSIKNRYKLLEFKKKMSCFQEVPKDCYIVLEGNNECTY